MWAHSLLRVVNGALADVRDTLFRGSHRRRVAYCGLTSVGKGKAAAFPHFLCDVHDGSHKVKGDVERCRNETALVKSLAHVVVMQAEETGEGETKRREHGNKDLARGVGASFDSKSAATYASKERGEHRTAGLERRRARGIEMSGCDNVKEHIRNFLDVASDHVNNNAVHFVGKAAHHAENATQECQVPAYCPRVHESQDVLNDCQQERDRCDKGGGAAGWEAQINGAEDGLANAKAGDKTGVETDRYPPTEHEILRQEHGVPGHHGAKRIIL